MPSLKPFAPISEELSLSGDLRVNGAALELEFQLADPKHALVDTLRTGVWPERDLARADGLWQSTCFEAFFAEPGAKSYWELNISAAGKWNLYRFDDYRQPQPPAACSDFALVSLETTPTKLCARLEAKIALPRPLEVSLTAVLKTRAQTYYFSTHHAGAKPDFHLRAGLNLRRE